VKHQKLTLNVITQSIWEVIQEKINITPHFKNMQLKKLVTSVSKTKSKGSGAEEGEAALC
jgi:hypothetical protein